MAKRINDELRNEVRRLLRHGLFSDEISERTGVSKSTIQKIRKELQTVDPTTVIIWHPWVPGKHC